MKLLQTRISRLRIIGFLEGISLLALIGIAVPFKYLNNDPQLVKIIGPIHGALFVLFVFNALGTAVEQRWKFRKTTWKVLVACMVPLGTFYIDWTILRKQDPAS